jgi:hypothetical protein
MLMIVQVTAAGVLSALGLSQVYRTEFWLAYYGRLSELGATAIRGHGAVVAAIGGAVVALHNVWSGPAVVLTLAAWLMIAEGGFCLLAPRLGLAALGRQTAALRHRAVVVTGIASLVVAGVLWVHVMSVAGLAFGD